MKKLLFTLMLLIATSPLVTAQELRGQSVGDPVISIEVLDEAVVINVTGEGSLFLYVDGSHVSIPHTIARTDVDQTVELKAVARVSGYRDRTVTEEYVVPRLVYTDAPVITAEEQADKVIITATGEGEIHLYADGVEVANPYVVARTDVEQTVELTATAHVDGQIDGIATLLYTVPALVYTEAPVITVEDQIDRVIFYATGDGEVRLYDGGVEVANPYTVVCSHDDQTVELTATAHVDGQIDGIANLVYVVHAMIQTDAPVITVEDQIDRVIFYATGDGEVRLYDGGLEVANPYTVPRSEVDQTVELTATAHVDGQIDGTANLVYVVHAMIQTDAPVITVEDQIDRVIFYATGDGEVRLYDGGVEVANPYTVPRSEVDQTVELTATAHVDGQIDGTASLVYVVHAMIQTDAPVIVCDVDDYYGHATISAFGEGEVHLYVDGMEVENPFNYGNTDCYGSTLDIVAIAHVDGQIDGYASDVCTISDASSLMGDIVIGDPEENGNVYVAYIGDEPVHLYVTVNGAEVEVVNNYITVGEGESVIDVQVTGGRTCQMEFETKTVTYVVPPTEQSDFPTFTFTPDLYDLYNFEVKIESGSPDAVIYYRYAIDPWAPDIESAEWNCAEGGVCYLGFNWETQECMFHFQAYAVEPGKLPSPIVDCDFRNEYDLYRRYEEYYDFEVDGIYYQILTDSTLAVSSEKIETTHGVYLLFPAEYNGRPIPSYSGDVVVPSTVEYNGTTYTVTSVKPFAFVGCELANVVLPNTVTEIGRGAFYRATLTSLVLPEALTECGVAAFGESKGLSEVVIPDAFTSIGGGMFMGSEDLTSVTLGNAVDIVYDDAFVGCPLLAVVKCYTTTPPTLEWVASSFSNYDSATLFVPDESLEAYQAHEEWGQFYRIVPFLGAGPGDINGDGTITVTDVVNIINMILNAGEDDLPMYCDVNGDGTVNIADITVLINMLLNAAQ